MFENKYASMTARPPSKTVNSVTPDFLPRSARCGHGCGFQYQNSVSTTERWVPHISLVFREMWDSTALSPPLLPPNLPPDAKGKPLMSVTRRSFLIGSAYGTGVALTAAIGPPVRTFARETAPELAPYLTGMRMAATPASSYRAYRSNRSHRGARKRSGVSGQAPAGRRGIAAALYRAWQPRPEVYPLLADFFRGVHVLSVGQRDGLERTWENLG